MLIIELSFLDCRAEEPLIKTCFITTVPRVVNDAGYFTPPCRETRFHFLNGGNVVPLTGLNIFIHLSEKILSIGDRLAKKRLLVVDALLMILERDRNYANLSTQNL